MGLELILILLIIEGATGGLVSSTVAGAAETGGRAAGGAMATKAKALYGQRAAKLGQTSTGRWRLRAEARAGRIGRWAGLATWRFGTAPIRVAAAGVAAGAKEAKPGAVAGGQKAIARAGRGYRKAGGAVATAGRKATEKGGQLAATARDRITPPATGCDYRYSRRQTCGQDTVDGTTRCDEHQEQPAEHPQETDPEPCAEDGRHTFGSDHDCQWCQAANSADNQFRPDAEGDVVHQAPQPADTGTKFDAAKAPRGTTLTIRPGTASEATWVKDTDGTWRPPAAGGFVSMSSTQLQQDLEQGGDPYKIRPAAKTGNVLVDHLGDGYIGGKPACTGCGGQCGDGCTCRICTARDEERLRLAQVPRAAEDDVDRMAPGSTRTVHDGDWTGTWTKGEDGYWTSPEGMPVSPEVMQHFIDFARDREAKQRMQQAAARESQTTSPEETAVPSSPDTSPQISRCPECGNPVTGPECGNCKSAAAHRLVKEQMDREGAVPKHLDPATYTRSEIDSMRQQLGKSSPQLAVGRMSDQAVISVFDQAHSQDGGLRRWCEQQGRITTATPANPAGENTTTKEHTPMSNLSAENKGAAAYLAGWDNVGEGLESSLGQFTELADALTKFVEANSKHDNGSGSEVAAKAQHIVEAISSFGESATAHATALHDIHDVPLEKAAGSGVESLEEYAGQQ